MAKKGTAAPSKSKKMELESSPEQLEILTVKEHNGQIMIEYRASNTSAKSIAGTDCEPRSNQTNTKSKVEDEFEFCGTSITQSIPTAGAEPQNYQTVHDGSTPIKVKDEVDIEIEDEMDFCFQNSTAQSNPETDDENHNNPPIEDQFSEIKVEDEIEFGEPSISVQSIPTNDAETQKYRTIQDEFAEIEDEMECGEEVEVDELNTLGTTVANKPDVSEGNKPQSEFICDICSKKFSKKYILNKHRLRHGKPKFNCTVCDAVKFNQFELDTHMKVHDTNPIYFTCDLCPKKYSSKAYLVEHMTTHDPNAKLFKCEICLKEFRKKKYRNKHRVRHGKPNFHCTICEAVKFNQFELDTHMKVHDTNPIYFTCDLCPKKSTSRPYMVRHKKTHDTKPLYFTCDLCPKKSTSKQYMVTHRKAHDTKPTCEICSKKFATMGILAAHRKTHDTNPIYFTCDLCPKKSTSKPYMVMHRKAHDTKPTCEICSKTFSAKGNLDRHMKKMHDTMS